MADVDAEASKRNFDVVDVLTKKLETSCRHIVAVFHARKLKRELRRTENAMPKTYSDRVTSWHAINARFPAWRRAEIYYKHIVDGSDVTATAAWSGLHEAVINEIIEIEEDRARKQNEMYGWMKVARDTEPCGMCAACLNITLSNEKRRSWKWRLTYGTRR